MLSDSDWDIERLREHHSAATAYRVTRQAGRVQIEARAAGQSCTLRQESPAHFLRPQLPPTYLLTA